jgi:hypothetical protein
MNAAEMHSAGLRARGLFLAIRLRLAAEGERQDRVALERWGDRLLDARTLEDLFG